MRVFLVVLLLLAGCAAAPDKQQVQTAPSVTPLAEPASEGFEAQRKCFEESKNSVCAYRAGLAAERAGDVRKARHWYAIAARLGRQDAASALKRLSVASKPAAPPEEEAQQPEEDEPMPEKPQPMPNIKGWLDTTGQGRGEAHLYKDSASCYALYLKATATAMEIYPEPVSADCPDCGTSNAKAVIQRQRNVRKYAYTAYRDCMAAKGWEKR